MVFHVTLDQQGRITNDTLTHLLTALKRNAPTDCNFSPADLVAQTLKIARKELRTAHCFEARLPDNTIIVFTATEPPAYTSWKRLFSKLQMLSANEIDEALVPA